ncbi:AAA family ATPase [Streptococcus mitis]|uniref:Endonuclease GajA/Old nuclease/RecF-like AAA domain-containing protein n=1 Tax=Streptococcus mitis TaxID=28037 RepID=A0A4U1KXX6_STRMT|nr:AAA family ATPase [Streptococcus mitis]TKD49219.1 hypothetical protein FBF73_07665 [Streptococcus mitis]
MKSIRIKNLRSIEDSQNIQINKCNFFIGANGTGKSSILRFFPLIKQTILQKSSSPILWYAKDGVDFGSYDESINKKNRDEGLTFTLEFNQKIEISSKLISDLLKDYPKYNHYFNNNIDFFGWFGKKIEIDFEKVEVTILKNEFSKLKFFFDSRKIEFDILNGKVIHGEKCVDNIDIIPVKSEYPLLPSLAVKHEVKKVSIEYHYIDKIIKLLQENTNKRIGVNTWEKIFDRISYSQDKNFLFQKLSASEVPKTIRDKFLSNEASNLDNLYNYIDIVVSVKLIRNMNRIISDYFKDTIYIAPIRATAERYYRVQGLSVEEVDPMGTNVPMILDYMNSNSELEQKWQDWTMEHFKTKYRATTQGGNTSIEVLIDNEFYNLADTGFGYSQFLPILLMLWQEERKNENFGNDFSLGFMDKKTSQKVIIIEQPELHLHPKMQAQFADLLFNLVVEADNINFIIETHSVTIINRIGELIERSHYENPDLIPEDNFNLFLVNSNESKKKIVQTRYDKNGIIAKWPIGFL